MVDIANLVIQTLIGIATFAAVCISLWQVRYEKRLREEESKRQQAIRVSLWYEGERNRTDCPKDDRFVWKSVVLRNESESPVYDVIVTCVGISGAGPERKGEKARLIFLVGLYRYATAWSLACVVANGRVGHACADGTRGGLHRCERGIVGASR